MDEIGASFPAIKVRGLTKAFGGHLAVDGLSFTVKAGECYGLLGPNGAGKSTTLKMLLGLTRPTVGTVEILGLAVPQESRQVRARLGVVPQNDALDPDFTVAENLRVFGRYFGLTARHTDSQMDALLDFAGLAGKHDASIGDLSGGMKRRLTLARALVNDPDILFLDEPTTGLDPQARHLIWERLKRLLKQGKTILLTTHFMEEAERLCDRLAIIDKGKLLVEANPLALIEQEIAAQVIEMTGDDAARLARLARESPGCLRVETVGDTVFAYCTEPQDLGARLAAETGLRWLQRRPTLEDVFLKLTGRDLRD